MLKLSAVLVSYLAANCFSSEIGVSLNSGMLTLKDEVALSQKVGGSLVALGGGFAYRLPYFRTDANVGTYFFKDNGGFSQSVSGSSGNNVDASSNAGMIAASLEAGPSITLGMLDLDIMGGVEYFAGFRTIENCIDCKSDSIDIPMMAYIMPRIHLFPLKEVSEQGNSMIGLSAGYLIPLNDSGVERGFRISISMKAPSSIFF